MVSSYYALPMQTISIPTESRAVLIAWRLGYGAIVRSACQTLRRDAGTALKDLTIPLYDRHRASGLDPLAGALRRAGGRRSACKRHCLRRESSAPVSAEMSHSQR
ncbi:hypothetical protein [Acetobacter persici]|uniref:hypothetical protein n=1 Tax=Acetobacter persici TaxID=1076596 RepID=UPI0012FE499A|nr:hypothetical protein [Acetobacter persici]